MLGYTYALSTSSEDVKDLNALTGGLCFNCTGAEEILHECIRSIAGDCPGSKAVFVLCSNTSE